MKAFGIALLWVLAALLGLGVLAVIFLGICALPVRQEAYETHSRFYRWLLNGATALSLWLLDIYVHTRGLEKLPEGRFLVVGNHRSNFDPIVTWYALKKYDLAFLSKEENFRIPIFGRIIRRCCFLPIDRQDPRKALTAINQAAALLEGNQVSIGVYPEGTRSKEGVLLPFHNGVFKIAKKAGVPIVVVAVQGTETIHKNYFRRPSHVSLEIVDVLPADFVAGSRTAEIGQRVRVSLEDALTDRKEAKHEKLHHSL